MSDSQNNQPNECKCMGDKRAKALEKQIAELGKKVDTLEKQLVTLRKVLTR